MQILHTQERGGIETLSKMISDGLNARGFEITTDYLFPQPGLSVIARLLCAVRLTWRILRSDQEAIVAYQATASILTGVAGFLRGCRLRIVHQTAIPAATAAPVRLADKITGALGLYSVNIANTVFTRREFADYPARYQRDMVLIMHGVARIEPERSRAATRARFRLPPDAPILLNVGRLAAQKNQHVLIEALARVNDAILLVAGHGPDEQALRNYAVKAGVADRVVLAGAVTPQDIADLYVACDLFAFPSTWETFGLAAAEAAMTGIAMIVADIAVLREVLASDASPVDFIAPYNVEGWTSAIAAKLENPPSQALRDAFAAQMRRRYAVNHMIDQYVELLSKPY